MLRHKGGALLTFTTFVMGEVLLSQLSESAVTYLEDILTSLGARVMDIPGLRSPFFIRCITPTVTTTSSLQSGQHHIILTPFIIMPVMDLLLVTGMIYAPLALAGIHIVVVATSFLQGLPLVTLVHFTLVVTRSL